MHHSARHPRSESTFCDRSVLGMMADKRRRFVVTARNTIDSNSLSFCVSRFNVVDGFSLTVAPEQQVGVHAPEQTSSRIG